MTYTHITTDELVLIEAYFHHGTTVSQIAKRLGRARQTVHNVNTYFRAGHTAVDHHQRYKENKQDVVENAQYYLKRSSFTSRIKWLRDGRQTSSSADRKSRLAA